MSTQSTSPNNGPVTAQNAGTTDIPTLMANATRTFAALPPAIMELGTIFHEAEEAAWVPLRDVSRQLAYPNERRIVRIALDLLYRDSRG